MKKFIEATSDCKGKGKIKRCINCGTITLFFPLDALEDINGTLNRARVCFTDGTYIDVMETYDELVLNLKLLKKL